MALTISSWQTAHDYTLNEFVTFEMEIYQCVTTHLSGQPIGINVGNFRTDFLIGRYWKKSVKNISRLWSTHRLYQEDEKVLYGFMEFRCVVRHEAGQVFNDDYANGIWEVEKKRFRQLPEWLLDNQTFADYVDAADQVLIEHIDHPTVELSKLRELSVGAPEDVVTLTAKMLGFDLQKYSGMSPNPFQRYLTFLPKYRPEAGTKHFVDFLSFILQVTTGKSWALTQLYSKNYMTFLRPVEVQGNNNRNYIDPESSLLYFNMPSIAYRSIRENFNAPPDASPTCWMLYDDTVPDKNVDLQVQHGNIIDVGGNSFEEAFNVEIAGSAMKFDGTVNSWVKLAPFQFTNVNNFTLEITFKVYDVEAKQMHCLVHFGNNLATSSDDEFFIAVCGDGSILVNFQSNATTIFPAGTVISNRSYTVVIDRTDSTVRSSISNFDLQGALITNSRALSVTAVVLGQEQDTDYGGFQESQALKGEITNFKFKKPGSQMTMRGRWDSGTCYKLNDIVIFSDTPGYYPTSRYYFAPSDTVDEDYGQEIASSVSKIFYDFAPANMVIQVNKPDYNMLVSGFPNIVHIGAENSEIDECIPIEYLCPIPYNSAGDRLIVQFN